MRGDLRGGLPLHLHPDHHEDGGEWQGYDQGSDRRAPLYDLRNPNNDRHGDSRFDKKHRIHSFTMKRSFESVDDALPSDRSQQQNLIERIPSSRQGQSMRATFLFLVLLIGAHAKETPNIVLLLADDLGWTGLSCYGSDFYETPNLDRLAAEGVKFTDAYAACTVCSPTRASLMTGKYPARLYLTDFIAGQNRPWAKLTVPDWQKGLLHEHTTLAEALKAQGYQTAMAGKWHLERPEHKAEDTPTNHGFDVAMRRPPGTRGYKMKDGSHLTDYLTDQAIAYIEGAANREEPFFLYMSYNVPHTPIQGRQELIEAFEKKRNPKAIHHNATYAAMVASLDQSAGRLMQTLEALQISDSTLVIFTSDNGGLTQRYGKHDDFTENLPLRRGKGSAYEGGVRVPAIIKWPGHSKPSTVCETPIMTIDYFPTLLKAAGAKGELSADGRNLLPILQEPSKSLERDLFWHYPHYHAGGDSPYSAIRSGQYRLIEFHEDKSIALYHLSNDLGEQHDLADELPDQALALQRKLHQWLKSVSAQSMQPNPNHDASKATRVVRKS